MAFHPTGPSARITVASQTPQAWEMIGLPAQGKVLRLVALTYPAKATCYVALGTSSVAVTSATGMPLSLEGSTEQFISIGDETHLALMMGSNANYEIAVTPGEMV